MNDTENIIELSNIEIHEQYKSDEYYKKFTKHNRL